MRRARQLSLPLASGWGGARRGAGRKPSAPGLRRVPHRPRAVHRSTHPVHVTLRASFRPLRSQHVFPTLRLAIAGSARRAPKKFRILHFSVQFDHVHLIVEAADQRELSAGLRSLVIRMARSVNALVRRKGRVWADRWHGRDLTSPRQVRNALVYVFANFRKHDPRAPRSGVDPFSSGAHFDGWRSQPAARAGPRPNLTEAPATNRARTWLARVGWRRHGLLTLDEAPARAPRS